MILIIFRREPGPEEFIEFRKYLVQKILIFRTLKKFPCKTREQGRGQIVSALTCQAGFAIYGTIFRLNGEEVFQQVLPHFACRQYAGKIISFQRSLSTP